jgi:arsenate reductase-like glutaredoxin family protein
LLDNKADIEAVDLNKGLSVAELDRLIGKRDYTEFLNTRNELYRRLGMKKNPPPREGALRLMAENPNLIKRPLMKIGGKLLVGFDGAEAAAALGHS